ncbi:MAG: hypothetical protein H6819_03060 [Phycisphaerales bacterium]|nr:hypothetical protein [Phycisphaerales bacterium]MCB9856176.1 hypothetical protein [Phycisphaerales bacterium]
MAMRTENLVEFERRAEPHAPIGQSPFARRDRFFFLCALILAFAICSTTTAQVSSRQPSTALAREAKRFDFDEQKLGNFEDLPMNWLPITGGSFPRFVEPAFDMMSGHDAPPSFRLQIQTGNVGAYYLAKDIPAHPGSEYRISAWVRTKGLENASAYITAYYLDHALQPIGETERYSEPVNAGCCGVDWTQVTVDLPGGVRNARWIALSCRIEQRKPENPVEGPFAPIPRRDANASAWFDDIIVIRRPRVQMALNRNSHFYFDDEPIRCDIKLLDLDGAGLDVTLKIDDAVGRTMQTFTLDGPALVAEARPVDFAALSPGMYTARLQMRLDRHVIAEHERRFVVLRRTMAGERTNGAGFGVVLSDESVDRPEIIDLIDRIRPGAVKLPLWRFGLTDDAVVYGDENTRNMIETFRRRNIEIVAVLDALPKSLAAAYEYPKRTIERALAVPIAEKNDWVPYLGLLLMRHGAWTNTWQLGDDHGAPRFDASTITAALQSVRQVIDPLIGKPRIVLPNSSFGGAQVEIGPDDIASTTFEFHQTPDLGADGDAANKPADPLGSSWATLSTTDENRYDREARLKRFARGLISSRAIGYQSVFVPALWTFEEGDNGRIIRPREELVLLNTVSRRLGDLPNATRMTLHPDIASWLFSDIDGRIGAIALWRPDEESEEITLDIPPTTEVHDVWGRIVETTRTEEGVRFSVGGMPVFVGPVSVPHMREIDSFEVMNAQLTASIRTQTRDVMLLNTQSEDLVGELLLQGPDGWRISPRRVPIQLHPGETLKYPIQLKPPSNAPAGWYSLKGRLDVAGDGDGETYVTTPIRVDAPGLEVNVFAHRDGDGIRFIQRITNTADRVMELRAYLIAPGRPRDARSINHLGAGETAVREFRVEPADTVEGGFVRISVEEIGGELKHNTVIQFNSSLPE